MTLKLLVPVPALVMMAAALILPAPRAHAAPMTFTAILSAANELPPPVPFARTRLATIVLNPTAQTLQVNGTSSGLTSPTVAAHIHCCAPLGTNAGVATTLPVFPGFPSGWTSGTYSSPVFDLTQPLIYNPAFVALQAGTTAGAEAALIAGIIGGQTYFNIHTVEFPRGRDQRSACSRSASCGTATVRGRLRHRDVSRAAQEINGREPYVTTQSLALACPA